jgi:hypothetical protein
MRPLADFKRGPGDKNWATAGALWKAFEGKKIRDFIKLNKSNIQIEKYEYNAIRVYIIV